MRNGHKIVAILGANKEGLSLLPVIGKDASTRVSLIADGNENAMLFKLGELGYKLSARLDIKLASDIEELKRVEGLDVIIDTLQDPATEKFLDQPEFKNVKKLGPLSAKLLWGVRSASKGGVERRVVSDRVALLGSLRELVAAERLASDRREVFTVILDLAIETTHAERGSIMLLSKDDGCLRMETSMGMDEEVMRKVRVPLGEGISGRVAKDGKPIMISGKAMDKDFQHPRQRSDAKCALCVPLVTNSHITGVINVSSSDSARAFTDDDMKHLTELAGLAAEVIQRSSEHEEMKVDAAKFAFWKEMESTMSSSLSMDKRLQAVCRRLAEAVPGLTCFIYLYDEERNRLFLRAASTKDTTGAVGPLSLVPGEGVEGWVMDARKPVVLVDRTLERAVKRTYLSFPMMSQERLVGIISGHVVAGQGLSSYHESFLKDMTDLVAENVLSLKHIDDEAAFSRKMIAVDEQGLEMMSIKDAGKLLKAITSTSTEILGAEAVLLRIRDEGSGEYHIVGVHGLTDKKKLKYFLSIEKEATREVLRKKEIVSREFSEEASPYIRGLLSFPIVLEERIEGLLTLFNKVENGDSYQRGFSKADGDIAARFVSFASRALSNSMDVVKERVKRQGYTLSMETLELDVMKELNRARRFGRRMVLATLDVPGGTDLPDTEDFIKEFYNYLTKKTRNFDTVALLDDGSLAILFPETDEKVMRVLANTVAAAGLGSPESGIYYGYATYPDDGDTFDKLFLRASKRAKLDFSEV